ncbi:hypothetical protein HZQ67_04085 [Elizabethkingia anophelis]|uniref:hypothetical protein n=1 Tax=Elizabethkingia anophelis TaxID=1117645 RepID=UPI0004E3715A|nr:hypothetical protein [Elizabethkingia anophelis]KFC35506.1 hypothetical protein FF18_03780 [Elizabethkingia anophelis]MCT3786545.1 hypothetical protein [Elizabethkingia anophelis]MDV3499504.1 hypothetical protein [Elizabethkingia anophelis]
MAYKLYYIEDLESESRKSDLENLKFQVEQYDPERNINAVVDKINTYDPDAIIMDYRLNNGRECVYYDAPTIAATLRNKHRNNYKEIPIILISNEGKIADFYKDFLNQDLFDYAIEKQVLNNKKLFFKERIVSYIESYVKIKNFNFDILKILGLEQEHAFLLHSLILKKLEPKKGQIYEYSRFINDNLIYAIGTLIGEDIVAARLGIDKSSEDWPKLLNMLNDSKYEGIFKDSHNRWWSEKIEIWWSNVFGTNNLRRLNANERVDLLTGKFKLNLKTATPTKLSKSTKFWTICKGNNNPIDPFDGIQIIKKDYKPWQEKEYFSKDYALAKIDKEKNFIDETDLKYLKDLAKIL